RGAAPPAGVGRRRPDVLHVRAAPPEPPRLRPRARRGRVPRGTRQGTGPGPRRGPRPRARHLRARPVVAGTAPVAERGAAARPVGPGPPGRAGRAASGGRGPAGGGWENGPRAGGGGGRARAPAAG